MSVSVTEFGVAVVDGDTHISQWVINTKRLDCDEVCRAVAEKHLKPGDVVVDGGACIGDHTIVYLNAVGPTGRVLAFEPSDDAFQCLCFNCPKAEIYHVGLGCGEGRMKLVRHENLGASYLVKDEDSSLNNVRVIDLDSLNLDRLNLLKLDVEGMELDALKGACRTIGRCRPIVLLELNDATLARSGSNRLGILMFLEEMNYKVEDWQDPESPQIDAIFFPNETGNRTDP